MRDLPVQFVKSRGATLGLESFSGPDAFSEAISPLALLAQVCDVNDPLLLIGEQHTTFGMDMRGQTIRGSRVEDGGITLEESLDDIDNVRKFIGAEKVALFGYSPGGFFTLHYALAYPERVSAIVLAEPAIFTDTEDLIQRARLAEEGDSQRAMEAMLQYIDPALTKAEKEEMAAQVVKDWQSPEIMGKVFRLHGEHQIHEKDLQALRQVPTLLIGGSKSPMNFHVKRIAAAVPEANLWWIQGASHLNLMDTVYAEEIADVCKRFFRSVLSREAAAAPFIQPGLEDSRGIVQ